MSKINIERVNQFISEMNEALKSVKSILESSTEDIIQNKMQLDILKYNLIIAIQATIDICYHVSGKLGMAPQSYKDCFKNLTELGIIDKYLSKRLEDLAGLRNILIHLYWKVDNALVCKTAKENLDCFPLFVKSLAKLDV
ncbi:MAG: DUF86 domain-containing protein [Candidatus Schekmanbacteria bacterium]|nr:DUF86 domain-containing protein [Candidatus Schekmanbacteria bacterium]